MFGCGKPVFDLIEQEPEGTFDVMFLLGTDLVSNLEELIERLHGN